jgi:hypothetical protein
VVPPLALYVLVMLGKVSEAAPRTDRGRRQLRQARALSIATITVFAVAVAWTLAHR